MCVCVCTVGYFLIWRGLSVSTGQLINSDLYLWLRNIFQLHAVVWKVKDGSVSRVLKESRNKLTVNLQTLLFLEEETVTYVRKWLINRQPSILLISKITFLTALRSSVAYVVQFPSIFSHNKCIITLLVVITLLHILMLEYLFLLMSWQADKKNNDVFVLFFSLFAFETCRWFGSGGY